MRVTTPRTATLDTLRGAVWARIAPDGPDAGTTHNGLPGLEALLTLSACPDHESVCSLTASAPPRVFARTARLPEDTATQGMQAHSFLEPPAHALAVDMAGQVAEYLIARQRGQQVSFPAERLVEWAASQLENGLGDERAHGQLGLDLAFAAAQATSESMPKVGDRLAARKAELQEKLSTAMKDGDVLSPYRALISAIMSEKHTSRLQRTVKGKAKSIGGPYTLPGALAAATSGIEAAAYTAADLSYTVASSVHDGVASRWGGNVTAIRRASRAHWSNTTLQLAIRKAPFWAAKQDTEQVLRPFLRQSSRGGGAGDDELLTMLLTGTAGAEREFRLQRDISYTFAVDKGLLTLEAPMRDKLSLSRAELDIPSDSPCFGDPYSRWLLHHFVGYDVPVLNSFALALHKLAARSKGTEDVANKKRAPYLNILKPAITAGWVSVDHAEEVHALSEAAEVSAKLAPGTSGLLTYMLLKLGTLCSAVFLLFATSSLVSFILAQTQQRMLRFTVALQTRVRARLPLSPLLAGHMVDSLIFVPIMLGSLFFMLSFFNDQLLAFLVMLAVWVCEVLNIIGCRTEASMRVFPRVFGLLMTWFHTYYLAYPFGFAYPAFTLTVLGLLTAGYHLWHTYEIPALLDGSISMHVPRAPAVAGVLMVVGTWGVGQPHPLPGTPTPAGPFDGPVSPMLPVAGEASPPTRARSDTQFSRPVRAASVSSADAVDALGHSTASGRNSLPGTPLRSRLYGSAGTSGPTSPVHSPSGLPLPPLAATRSPQRSLNNLPLTGLGLMAASSPFSATYRPSSLSDVSLTPLQHPMGVVEQSLPVGVGLSAAREAAAQASWGSNSAAVRAPEPMYTAMEQDRLRFRGLPPTAAAEPGQSRVGAVVALGSAGIRAIGQMVEAVMTPMVTPTDEPLEDASGMGLSRSRRGLRGGSGDANADQVGPAHPPAAEGQVMGTAATSAGDNGPLLYDGVRQRSVLLRRGTE